MVERTKMKVLLGFAIAAQWLRFRHRGQSLTQEGCSLAAIIIARLYEEKVGQRRGVDDDTEVEAESGAIAAKMKKNEMRLKVAMGALWPLGSSSLLTIYAASS